MTRHCTLLLALLAASLLLCGCRNELPARFSRYSIGMPCRGPQATALLVEDFAWCAGLTAILTVTWTGGTGPYTFSADMGGGTTENIPAGTPATCPFTHTFTLAGEGTFVYTVTVIDANNIAGTYTGAYTVEGEYGPLVLAAKYDRLERILRVATAQKDGVDTTIAIVDPEPWVNVQGGLTRIVRGGTGIREFALDLLPDPQNACTLAIAAIDGDYARTTEVLIERPLYINQSYWDSETGVIAVEVDATYEQEVTVALTPPDVVTIDGDMSQTQESGGEFVFNASWDSETFPGGELEILASDQLGNEDAETLLMCASQYDFAPDTLYACPQQTAATTGEPVLVVVACGMPANPFQYMNGIGVTVNSGAAFVDGTFNVGAPGGDQYDPDGIWSTMDPLPMTFLLPADWMMMENQIEEERVRIDFNVTPIGGSNVTDGGELFNFSLEFDHAGRYILGFEEFRSVKRTYYSDMDSYEYFWGDISNDYPNVPNSVFVF